MKDLVRPPTGRMPAMRILGNVAIYSVVLTMFLTLFGLPAFGQTITSQLTGTVTDTSGAVIPGAKVTLTNQNTAVTQTTTSNASGNFVFTALMPGTYTVEVSSKGFASWVQKDIVLHSNESATVPDIRLQVATTKQQVTVQARALAMVPLNTGASSTTLNNRMVSNLSIQGRDAAELIKLMPGMAINNGLNNSEWNSRLTQINTGPIGSFSASGTSPYGGMQMISNGSVITDPGNQGTQTANVNQDMTAEVTIKDSAFDAQYAHGPVTFQATGKQGGAHFHGEGYFYARNGVMNSNDSFFKASGIAKPSASYYYPGANLGGPILLPFTNFNKNHDRAFFFVGFERLQQQPSGVLHKYMVPTTKMMNGNFTASALQGYSGFAAAVPCADAGAWNYGNFCQGAVDNGQVTLYQPDGSTWTPSAWDAAIAAHNANPNTVPYPTASGATINSGIDPNGLALMKALASAPGLTSLTPTATNPYNAEFLDNPPVNSDEFNIRGDVNVTQKMHAFVSFTRQPETDINSIGVWWWSPASVPFPSQMPASQVSRDWSVGVTNTISPSLVNEATFGWAYFINPIALANPSAANPSTYGYNVPLPPKFTQASNVVPLLPNIVTWCCGIESGGGGGAASATTGAGFGEPSFGSTWNGSEFGKNSSVPDFSDNLTWIKGKHTMKFGFFFDSAANVQTENSNTAGTWDFDNYAVNTSFNYYSDMLMGHAQGYSTSNINYTDYVKYNEIDFYAQDSWKLLHNFTVNYGVRFEHEGQWYPYGSNPQGIMVWDPNNSVQPYVADTPPYSSANENPLAGFVWHGIDKNIPVSGYSTRSLFADPRVGAAWDIFGNGKTVLRGGFGMYRSQIAYNDVTENAMLSAPYGVKSFASSCTFTSLDSLGTCGAAAGALRNTTTFAGLVQSDNKVPYTENWDVILDQAAPWHSTFELQYQGNRGRDLLITANGAGGIIAANINYPALGSLFKPDPVGNPTGLPNCYNSAGQEVNTNWTANVNCSDSGDTFYWQGTVDATHIAGGPQSTVDFLPYQYSNVDVFNHNAYSNYNALMVEWMKQSGPVVLNLNYTWSHTLGIWSGNNDNGGGAGPPVNAFCLKCGYGPLPFGRSQIFNAAYVIDLPGLHNGNRFVKGAVNGWVISGDTQYQTGPPLQPLTGGTLNQTLPAGVDNSSVFGTNSITLLPTLTCNPGSGLSSGQDFNPNCFRAPSVPTTTGASVIGANGPYIWPNITGPAFFNSDLGLYKNFHVTESQRVQFRITAFNFLNHPLPQFNLTNDINLSYAAAGGSNTNGNTTGKPAYTIGDRTVELAIKYIF